MNLLTALMGGALLAMFTAIQTWINKGHFDRIDAELRASRAEILQLALAIRRDA